MGRPEHGVVNSPRDLVLLIVHATGGELHGRTTLQKLAYFVAWSNGRDAGHAAHFFGPFSPAIEDGTMLAVIAGELDETIKRVPDWRGGPDLRQYIYRLTAAGQERVQEVSIFDPELAGAVARVVESARSHVPDLSQRTLSTAAKIALIVRREGSIEVGRIPVLASKLGWLLTPSDVDQTIGLLTEFGLVTQTN